MSLVRAVLVCWGALIMIAFGASLIYQIEANASAGVIMLNFGVALAGICLIGLGLSGSIRRPPSAQSTQTSDKDDPSTKPQ